MRIPSTTSPLSFKDLPPSANASEAFFWRRSLRSYPFQHFFSCLRKTLIPLSPAARAEEIPVVQQPSALPLFLPLFARRLYSPSSPAVVGRWPRVQKGLVLYESVLIEPPLTPFFVCLSLYSHFPDILCADLKERPSDFGLLPGSRVLRDFRFFCAGLVDWRLFYLRVGSPLFPLPLRRSGCRKEFFLAFLFRVKCVNDRPRPSTFFVNLSGSAKQAFFPCGVSKGPLLSCSRRGLMPLTAFLFDASLFFLPPLGKLAMHSSVNGSPSPEGPFFLDYSFSPLIPTVFDLFFLLFSGGLHCPFFFLY